MGFFFLFALVFKVEEIFNLDKSSIFSNFDWYILNFSENSSISSFHKSLFVFDSSVVILLEISSNSSFNLFNFSSVT